MAEQLIHFDNFENVLGLFGSLDENIKILESEYDVTVVIRGDTVKITGDDKAVKEASKAVDGLLALLSKGGAQ